MTDFFREVDEEVRRDRFIQFWIRHQNRLIGLAVLIVAATAAWQLYSRHRLEEQEAAGARYEAAAKLSREGKSSDAAAAFEALSKTAPKGYAALARLRAAAARAANEPELAIEAYDSLAADPSLEPRIRDFAKLRAAMLRVDRDDPLEFEKKFAPLAADSFPYHHQMRELLGLAALRRNAFDAAGRWFDSIVSDPAAPVGTSMHAQALLGLVQSASAFSGGVKHEEPPSPGSQAK